MATDNEFSGEEYEKYSDEAKKFFTDLRLFMRDREDFNMLQDEKEASADTLVLATRISVETFNSTPPVLKNFTLAEILNLGLLEAMLYYASSSILMQRAQQQERNMLTYSDGGRTETINDKAEYYKNTYQMLRTEAKKMFVDFKVAYNMRSGYGNNKGLHSGYAYIDDCL